jgi:hypothetical protein
VKRRFGTRQDNDSEQPLENGSDCNPEASKLLTLSPSSAALGNLAIRLWSRVCQLTSRSCSESVESADGPEQAQSNS